MSFEALADTHTHEVDIANSNLFDNNETDQVLKVLRNDNPSNLNFCCLNSFMMEAVII